MEIKEEQIGRLVEAFYAKVRVDPEIGPIFNAIVSDWPHHLSVLKDFWSTVLLTTGRYKGDPAMRHIGLGLAPEHFDRWLALFSETTKEIFPAETADWVLSKAQRIGRNFQDAAAFVRDMKDSFTSPTE